MSVKFFVGISLLLLNIACIAATPKTLPMVSIFSESPHTVSNKQAIQIVKTSIPNINLYYRLTIQKHDDYLNVILQKYAHAPIKIMRINFHGHRITKVINNYAAIRRPYITRNQNTLSAKNQEKMLIIAVNANIHADEVLGIENIYNQAISLGYANNDQISILTDSQTQTSLQKTIPNAHFITASLTNVESYLYSTKLASIFYYGDGFPNAFELANGDFLTAQDIQAMLSNSKHPFTLKNKIFIADACNAFLYPMGKIIVEQGQATAYVAGITEMSPQGLAVQLFINYVLKQDHPFKQAFADAQKSIPITDFGRNKVLHGIYGMAGTQVSNLFPKVSSTDQTMASITNLSASEPFTIQYTFKKPPSFLGYSVVTIDTDQAVNLKPGSIFTVPMKMPLVSNPTNNFASTSPASFTPVSIPYQGHTIYMIGNLSEVFALNQFTGSPASDVIYKDNNNDPTSMPKLIDYANPWWNKYYKTNQ